MTNFDFLLFVIFVFLGFVGDELLNGSLDLLENGSVSFLLNCRFLLEARDLAVTIVNQGLLFGALPVFTESLDSSQDKTLLVISELTVLTHSVHAHNKLLLRTDERSELNWVPVFLFSFKGFVVCGGLFLSSILFVVKLIDFLLLFLFLQCDVLEVGDCIFKSIISQAGLVN